MLIDDAPVLVDDFDGNRALGGGERHREARFHIPGDAGGGAAHGNQLFGSGGGRTGAVTRRRLLLEDALPALVDGAVVVQILLI